MTALERCIAEQKACRDYDGPDRLGAFHGEVDFMIEEMMIREEMEAYSNFLRNKQQEGSRSGFRPTYLPSVLFDFQAFLSEWHVEAGKSALFSECGTGKGQPPSAPVLTPTGWKPIGELKVGDDVISSTGNPCSVLGVFHKEPQDTWRVWFSDRSSLVVDSDHLHIVRTNNDRYRGNSWRVMSTRQLISSGNLRYGSGGKSRNYDIPVVGPVQFVSLSALPLDPYVLGVILGDGGLTGGSVTFTSGDPEIAERVSRSLPTGCFVKHGGGIKYSIRDEKGKKQHRPSNRIKNILSGLGIMGKLSHDKAIPTSYLFAGVEDRLSLLRGLMDTDGYVADSCFFYSTSHALADGVEFLVRSLGGVPTRSIKRGVYKKHEEKIECRLCHIVTFSLATMNPFYLSRKAALWNSSPRDNGRWIDRIEYESVQPTVCILVDSPDNSYVTEHLVVTHNSFIESVWSENVLRHTNRPVLLLTMLGVRNQMCSEAAKAGVEMKRSDGKIGGPGIYVTNYEKLHLFSPHDFAGVVADESSAIKSMSGKRRADVTEFMRTIPYRLCATATPAPNDYIELGTTSEALGVMGQIDMLNRFFKNDNNTSDTRMMVRKPINQGGPISAGWRFKGHAELPFWRWLPTWARAGRRPSDFGPFDDSRFILPRLITREHIVTTRKAAPGMLFPTAATNRQEELEERRRTIEERCEKAAELVNGTGKPFVVWCQLNPEGDLLEKLIPDAVQVAGADSDDAKEEAFGAFVSGKIRGMISKQTIAGFGANWQHCPHVVEFADHSFERHYQGVRRCWRFGQESDVVNDVIATEGQRGAKENLERKSRAADRMFTQIVKHMNDAERQDVTYRFDKEETIPAWL